MNTAGHEWTGTIVLERDCAESQSQHRLLLRALRLVFDTAALPFLVEPGDKSA